MNPNTTTVYMTLTHPISNDGERRVTLRIADAASLLSVLDVDLSTQQFADLMGARSVQATAKIPQHPERIGRDMFSRAEYVPSAVTDVPRDEQRTAADAWAYRRMLELNESGDGPFAQHRVTRRQGGGFTAHFYGWQEKVRTGPADIPLDSPQQTVTPSD